MDVLDLWLLEVAMELPTPLHMLVEPNPHVALNMPDDPRFSREELCERLSLLAERGLIRIHELPDGLEELYSPEEISRAIDARKPRSFFGYELTPEGGAAWERLARPDWGRYVNAGQEPTADDAPNAWVIEAASLETAEEELRFHEQLGDENQPVHESKRVEELVPWQVTYWKTLPRGYRLHYITVPRPRDVQRTMSVPARPPWYTRAWL
ncbi:hypothetical protein HPC49_24460 [Pyxidicoccus fallax]|uniref:Uncharacterized protein n=1 Tax=Pyxidicoccus fallax TaxID=394095 RepID=A0A848LS34_9BACT|nr:hypothetical protein [Pyxidicoccus fallax]NPC81370.1 hypothetical protein [Pyxidicoccus fallax]